MSLRKIIDRLNLPTIFGVLQLTNSMYCRLAFVIRILPLTHSKVVVRCINSSLICPLHYLPKLTKCANDFTLSVNFSINHTSPRKICLTLRTLHSKWVVTLSKLSTSTIPHTLYPLTWVKNRSLVLFSFPEPSPCYHWHQSITVFPRHLFFKSTSWGRSARSKQSTFAQQVLLSYSTPLRQPFWV